MRRGALLAALLLGRSPDEHRIVVIAPLEKLGLRLAGRVAWMAGPVLITGGHGFVGAHLQRQLGERAVPSDADVTDIASMHDAVAKTRPHSVVHLAALSSVGDSWEGAQDVWRVNVLGTVNVLEAVGRDAPDARVLVVSTGQVYGDAETVPTPEASPVAPKSPYAASKAAAELACAPSELDTLIARPFQHEGPGRDERFAVGSWTRQIARLEVAGGGTLHVGDLTSRRDIIDVRDVCRAYELLLDRNVPTGVYNIASGNAFPMQEVLDLLVAQARCLIEVELDPGRVRPNDPPAVAGDATKLKAATGWEPRIPLEQTLADALEAARASVTEVSSV